MPPQTSGFYYEKGTLYQLDHHLRDFSPNILFDAMNKPNTPIAFWVMSAAALVLVCAMAVPLLARSTNCGGNTAALTACRSLVGAFEIVATDRGGKSVTITDLTEKERENFRHPGGINWLGGGEVLVTKQPVIISETGPKTIIAVCTAAYDNVPRRWIGKSPMTHAAAYSDGSVGLISVPNFQRLDLSRFVDVARAAGGRVEPSGAANPGQPVRSDTNRASSAAGPGR